VVISSILARFGVPGYTGYCASKAALLGLTRALALEVAAQGITVNAICPGWVDTAMAWEGIEGMAAGMGITRDEAFRMAMGAVPQGRMGRPEEVAGLVSWLLSPAAANMTGQGIDMNGGAWMG
jgi:NAD(P)-dependent dehydrogenase (short-subunit alcohol dehydrogenase family)